MIVSRIEVSPGTAVLRAVCNCGMHFAVIEALQALEEQEIRPRFCPFCAARVSYQTTLAVERQS